MAQSINSPLEIRCAYARARVLEQIHGEACEITQDAMSDVHEAVFELAASQVKTGFQTASPTIFSETWLADAWNDGIQEAHWLMNISKLESQP